jgi:hypothetical protein
MPFHYVEKTCHPEYPCRRAKNIKCGQTKALFHDAPGPRQTDFGQRGREQGIGWQNSWASRVLLFLSEVLAEPARGNALGGFRTNELEGSRLAEVFGCSAGALVGQAQGGNRFVFLK